MDIEHPEWLQQVGGLLESLNEGVMITDECHRIVFLNSCLEEMIGRPSIDMVGRESSQFYTREEFVLLSKEIERGEVSGRNRFEFVLPHLDGSRVPVIISARRIEDPDGRTFAIVTFTDISDQKNAEAQLRHANTKLAERQQEIEEDLALAARVQQSLAPQSLVWGNLRVDSYFHPVRTIGGDFGLVSSLDDDHLSLLVCNVSGHGIGSALVANRIYAETITQLRTQSGLGSVLHHLNRFVMQNIGSSVFFFTLAAARVTRDGRRMVFAGAGHPPGMIVRAGEAPRLLESRSMVLGALSEAVGGEATLDVELDPGDRIVLYTDGITNVFDTRGEMLGVEGVEQFVRETSNLPFSQMKQGLLDRVAAWRDGPTTDDVSIVLAEIQ